MQCHASYPYRGRDKNYVANLCITNLSENNWFLTQSSRNYFDHDHYRYGTAFRLKNTGITGESVRKYRRLFSKFSQLSKYRRKVSFYRKYRNYRRVCLACHCNKYTRQLPMGAGYCQLGGHINKKSCL